MRKTLEVYKASTYVRLTGYKPELIKQILMPFCKRNFARVQKVPGELYGTHKWEVTHVFARFNNDKTELRFCASMLPELLKLMTSSGYKESRISIQDEKVIKPKKVTLPLLNPKIKPRDEEQEEFCEFMMNEDPLSINNLPPGRGKAQPLSSLVKVPNGWKKMGDIQPGDKVTAWDGTTVNVLSIHPQGVKDIYEFTFADGRTARSTLDHLWKVFDRVSNSWVVLTTNELIQNGVERFSIPLYKPINDELEDFTGQLEMNCLVIDGKVEERTFMESRAEYITELVRSLGGICECKFADGFFTVTGNINPVENKLGITSVFKVSQEEAQCISIDHPDHLYVTDNYVVTHNTFCALFSAHHVGERVLITVLPRFVDIWVKAFGEFYNIKPEDVVVADIIGVTELHQAIVNNVIDPKIIILPLTKIDIYLKKLREDENLPSLDQVFDDLGCGIRVIDEAHESIYSVYNSLMFGNHKRTFVLSGTLKGDDEFVNKIYNAIFPFSCYLRSPEHTPYMHVVAYFHRMDMFKHRINVKGFGGFSQNLLEAGILKRPQLFESYYQMLMGAYKQFYLDDYREGQKVLWFFGTIDFCEKFNERLLQDYPDLDSIVFTSKTNKKDPTAYREHRCVVTTPGSCGTGRDIPKLFTVFSPIAVSSSQRNNQMVCRTRPVDKWWPGLMPNFVYFVCSDIPKTVEYGRKRRELFQGVCKKFSIIDSGVRL